MATFLIPPKWARRLQRYLAQEAEVPFAKVTDMQSHSNGDKTVRVEFTVVDFITEERFNELLQLAQQED